MGSKGSDIKGISQKAGIRHCRDHIGARDRTFKESSRRLGSGIIRIIWEKGIGQ